VILKYTSDEARNLKAYGELPESGEAGLISSKLRTRPGTSIILMGAIFM